MSCLGEAQIVSYTPFLSSCSSIKCDNVKQLYCPQYENLNIVRILERAKQNPFIANYLPENRDMHKVPRQWLINVAYTVIGKPFAEWVDAEIANRNDELAKKQKLLIEMDPEIAKAFHNSVNISSKVIRHSIFALRKHLTFYLSCSFKWQRCPSPKAGLQAQENAGRDEGVA